MRGGAWFGAGAAAVVLTAGCAHTVEFASDPPGARIVVNNEYVGDTPCKGEFRLNTSSTLDRSYEILAYPPPGMTEVPAQYRFLGRWDEPPARMFFYFKLREPEP
jgi:hypothetical protein